MTAGRGTRIGGKGPDTDILRSTLDASPLVPFAGRVRKVLFLPAEAIFDAEREAGAASGPEHTPVGNASGVRSFRPVAQRGLVTGRTYAPGTYDQHRAIKPLIIARPL
jgi:hypothetical protein